MRAQPCHQEVMKDENKKRRQERNSQLPVLTFPKLNTITAEVCGLEEPNELRRAKKKRLQICTRCCGLDVCCVFL